MGLKTKKAGTRFGTVNNNGPEMEFAMLAIKAAKQVGLPITWELIANSLGTISAEGGFVKGRNWTSGVNNRGPWALNVNPPFENTSEAERLDPWHATLAAMKFIKKNGGNNANGFRAWWPFEESQGEAEGGQKRAARYANLAKTAVQSAGGSSGPGGILGTLEEVPVLGGILEGGEAVVEASVTAEEFLQEALETLLNFEKLGKLAVDAFAWFLRLLAKAIWDFVLAPLVHWTERSVTWYWTNFFGTGTEEGSGFGFQIRNNAGIITILFWSIGYAVLWSDGSGSMVPVSSHKTMLGQTIKGVEGAIARRNVTSPEDVDKETPTKPKPVTSSVIIEKVDEFSVNRPRPVKVSRPTEVKTGRVEPNERSRQQRKLSGVPRPKPGGSTEQKAGQTQSGEKAAQIIGQTAGTPAKAASNSRARTVPRTNSGPRSKGNRGSSREARPQSKVG